MAQRFFVGNLKIESPAFAEHERIPDKHTANGDNVSPALSWSGAPEGTKQFAIVCHDPDAPLVDGFTHWVVYGVGADVNELPEGAQPPLQGIHQLGGPGYTGPAPPPGHGTHHYYFWVYALDAELDLAPGLSRAQLLSEIEDHVLEQARLLGTYSN